MNCELVKSLNERFSVAPSSLYSYYEDRVVWELSHHVSVAVPSHVATHKPISLVRVGGSQSVGPLLRSSEI